MADNAKSPAALKSEYDALAKQAAAFDRETTLALRKLDDERRKFLDQRKEERAKLLARKLAVSVALHAAQSAPVPAPAPAAEPAKAEAPKGKSR